ncbi:MAG: helix-turn-helix domain-containing protein, partial [Acidobacteriaceae bacterium]|nr:helix-turn-helix domain-containing protein [Acidobacteriaceae bacterium]
AAVRDSANGEVAKRLHITGATVCKWRERFRVKRLEGLLDEPRPGTPRSITDAQVELSSYENAGVHADQQHALEHSAHGSENGPVTDGHRANLACFRIAAASRGEL